MKKDFIKFVDAAIKDKKGIKIHIERPEHEVIGSDGVKRKEQRVKGTRNITSIGLSEERDNIINDYDDDMHIVGDKYFTVTSWETF